LDNRDRIPGGIIDDLDGHGRGGMFWNDPDLILIKSGENTKIRGLEELMKSPQMLRSVAGLLALIAMWLCYSLLSIHAAKSPDLGLLAGVCGDSGESCSSVVNGRWGVFPPGEEGSEGPYEGIPVAGLGFVYFSLLAGWYLLVSPAAARVPKLANAIFGFNVLGLFGSIAYTLIMLTQIGTTCGLCLISHGCNLGILGIGLILRKQSENDAEVTVSLSRHLVTVGVVVLCCATMAVLVYSEGQFRSRYVALEEQSKELMDLARDVEKVETAYRSSPRMFEQDAIREDDPRRKATGGLRYQLVIFSDIQCSNCARFEEYLQSTIMPIWNGHLEVVWKHLPNTREHEYAQISAQALEAARIQGKFWELVDYLFERRKVLGTLDWSAVSAELGMETRKFLQDMESPAVKRRIAEDAALGRKAGVKGTPGVFLNRRPVSRLMRKSPGFWEIQADSLREIRASRNQDW